MQTKQDRKELEVELEEGGALIVALGLPILYFAGENAFLAQCRRNPDHKEL